ncbi:GNAT family N-acetyltransferase [Actinomadura rugatobispora]|uniref:GNAT family N-acetyltransferase n=1 Tax=Actinomadura rugatobispora TaxID=1994 RepID=A0ABW1AB16_9ACTN|nr:GNAT family N-acetyltransferase [Actinomadura rugatobispora]
MIVRPATADDIPELTRLRELLFRRVMDSADQDADQPREGNWREEFARDLKERLGGSLGVFVVDGEEDKLAACGLGVIEYRLPGPYQGGASAGYVLGMVTDPLYRGRGYARLIMQELLAWFRGKGVSRVDLHAPAEGAALYRSMGFQEHQVALTWHAPQA